MTVLSALRTSARPGVRPLLPGLVLLLGLAGASAHAQEADSCEQGENLLAGLSPAASKAIEREAAGTANGEGRLFRIEREGVAASYLFGTMHLSDPRVLALPGPAEKAFEKAGQLVVETLDIRDEAKVAGALLARPDLTLLPAGSEFSALLPPERRAEIEATLEARGMPAGTIRTLQPWFVSVALAVPPCEAERQAQGRAVLDVDLLERAEASGKSLAGLETAAEQMEAIASMPLELQVDNLVATIDLLDSMPDIFETMIDLYLAGRIAAITPAIETLAPETGGGADAAEIYAAFEERVITQRNRTMAERLEPILAEGENFVAVGALHLPGEAGLVELLREDGWTLTRAD